ncbi:MAG TPA: hypothetical protein VF227_02460 [Actinomycetes bacterium]
MRHFGLAGLFGRVLRRGRRRRLDLGVIDASFHVDTEAICPDCLQWINPWDYVRRNAFDLLEHEVCPPVVVRQSRG